MTNQLEAKRPVILRPVLAAASLAQIPALYFFARHVERSDELGLLSITIFTIAMSALGAWAAWSRRTWVGWPVLTCASWAATTGLWGVSVAHENIWWTAVGLATFAFLLVLWTPGPRLTRIPWSVRLFCFAVFLLTRYVAFWGLFFPTGVSPDLADFAPFDLASGFNDAMPFVPEIPTLHARFIGSLYLGASVICFWHVFARSWAVARLLQALIFLWTAILLAMSLWHLDAFNWESSSVWLWFIAYFGYPAVSIWIWTRVDVEPDRDTTPLHALAKTWLYLQGAGLITLSSLGLFAVEYLGQVWPWKLPPLLGHIYSAPFLTFGIGSVCAARLRGAQRRALLPFATATFAMAAGTLAATIMHSDKFASSAVSTWVWVASLGAVTVASAALAGHVGRIRCAEPRS